MFNTTIADFSDAIATFVLTYWAILVIGYLVVSFIAPVFTATRWTLTRRKP